MGANGDLAQNISKTPPWWATAPIWLAAGIVGVPSLMAIGMGYFVAGSVTKHLSDIKDTNVAEMRKLDLLVAKQQQYFEMVRRLGAQTLEVQIRTCVHGAENKKEQDDCLRGVSGVEK